MLKFYNRHVKLALLHKVFLNQLRIEKLIRCLFCWQPKKLARHRRRTYEANDPADWSNMSYLEVDSVPSVQVGHACGEYPWTPEFSSVSEISFPYYARLYPIWITLIILIRSSKKYSKCVYQLYRGTLGNIQYWTYCTRYWRALFSGDGISTRRTNFTPMFDEVLMIAFLCYVVMQDLLSWKK